MEELRPARIKITGQDVKLVHTVVVRAVKANWPWVAIYVATTVAGIIAAYFTSGWWSVAVSTCVAVITFFVGLRMLQQVVTITNEVR